MGAYKPAKPGSIKEFPLKIEGLPPSIWENSYKKESDKFHKVTDPCMLCDRIRKAMEEINKCHRYKITQGCSSCSSKARYAPYLDRGLLSDLHSSHLELLTRGSIGGEVISSTDRTPAKAWQDPHNTNKHGETLETQIKRELAKFTESNTLRSDPAPGSLLMKGEESLGKKRESVTGRHRSPTDPEPRKPSSALTTLDLSTPNPDMNTTALCAASLGTVDKEPSHPSPVASSSTQLREINTSPFCLDEESAWIEDDPWEQEFYLGSSYPPQPCTQNGN